MKGKMTKGRLQFEGGEEQQLWREMVELCVRSGRDMGIAIQEADLYLAALQDRQRRA